MPTDHIDVPPQPERRNFLTRLSAVLLGAMALLPVLAGGVMVLFDPLRRQAQASGFIFIATLNALPEDGTPRKFSVITDQVDAWNTIPQVPVGAVYLRRVGHQVVRALNVVCPHAGCFVNVNDDLQGFLCPCHKSSFTLEGKIADPNSPSARGLDELKVEIRHGGEVWVKFQNFRAGVAEKIPV